MKFCISFECEKVDRLLIICYTFVGVLYPIAGIEPVIMFAFYYVFNRSKKEECEFCIDNLINIQGFEAIYKVTIYSNKNVNNYCVFERADFLSDSYNIKVDGGIEINTNSNESVINYDGANTSYSYNLEEDTLNIISISYIIKNINSNYEIRENDSDYICSVEIDNELFNNYEIYVSKKTSKITKVCLYNHEGIVQIITDCINFEVKK